MRCWPTGSFANTSRSSLPVFTDPATRRSTVWNQSASDPYPAGPTGYLHGWDVPGVTDTAPLAERAIKRDILLAPGTLFSPTMSLSTKMRFNIAYCQEDQVFRELEVLMRTEAVA